ncbi:MAG: C10 family peptidase [Bacteroidales bacterium]|nr:C10 family peptidase [Bacteroidales bacterium]
MKKINNIKWGISLWIPLFSVWSLCAQSVSVEEASAIADAFFTSQGKSLSRCAYVKKEAQDTLFYVFNATDGYVVVAGDRRAPSVLAFSEEAPLDMAQISPAAQMWLDHYASQIAEFKQRGERAVWQQKAPVSRDGIVVAPLVASRWGQGKNYNYECPRDLNGPGGRVVTGCVATAMAQLIYYFRFPETGIGSYAYTDSTYGVQSADYEHTTYHYEEMCDRPTVVNPAIARLMHHCGVGVDMVYGPNGSGMYNHSAAHVLKTYFKFSPETQYVFRDSTQLDWDSLIVTHLEQEIPLYYAGWSVPNINGHGFICDGYQWRDSSYYYHFNFGWDGSSDGYFYTDALNAGGGHFNLAQELIIHAVPDTVNYPQPAVQPLTDSVLFTCAEGSFCGGTPRATPAGMDVVWTIRPDVQNLLSIRLDLNYVLPDGDSLWISCDNPAISPQTVTGDTGILNINWECGEVMVHYLTSSSTEQQGLRGSFNAMQPEYCLDYQRFNHATGTISDGSGEDDYNSLTYCCYYLFINRPYIALHFTHFDLEEGHDFLYVLDGMGSGTQLAAYTGTLPDTTVCFEKRRLYLVFETDATNNASGFDLEFEGRMSDLGMGEHAGDRVSIYPNPTSDIVEIQCIERMDNVILYDQNGRVVMEKLVNDTCERLDLSRLPAGIYYLNIMSDGNASLRKIIKK